MQLSSSLLSVLLGGVTGATASGQAPKPRFNDYRAGAPYAGPCAVPLLQRGTNAWQYRSQIRRIAAQKPNFAGHYSVGTWGCGSECLHYAIVDAQTGKVYYNQSQQCDWTFGLTYRDITKPIEFHLSSRLFILDGSVGGDEQYRPHYFKFEQGRLVALR
jgi:hypothetical protein